MLARLSTEAISALSQRYADELVRPHGGRGWKPAAAWAQLARSSVFAHAGLACGLHVRTVAVFDSPASAALLPHIVCHGKLLVKTDFVNWLDLLAPHVREHGLACELRGCNFGEFLHAARSAQVKTIVVSEGCLGALEADSRELFFATQSDFAAQAEAFGADEFTWLHAWPQF